MGRKVRDPHKMFQEVRNLARHYDENQERFYKSPRASELGAVPLQCSSCNNLVFAEFMEDSKGLIALICPNCKSVTNYTDFNN